MVVKRRQSSGKLNSKQTGNLLGPARASIPIMPPSGESTSPGARVGTTRTIIRASRVPSPSVEPSLLEQAEGLRDAIHRSRLSHPETSSYTPRTHSWGVEAQRIIDEIAEGKDSDTCRRAYEVLAATVESDPEFQMARRLF